MGDSRDLRTLLLEGLLYEKDGSYVVCQQGIDVDLLAALTPFVGRVVQMALFYSPPSPIVEDAWGLGCCHWQGAGTCPAGHHVAPGRLGLFKGAGTLQRAPWGLLGPDGSLRSLDPVLQEFPGHDVRVMVVTTDFDPSASGSDISKLLHDLSEMRQIVSAIQQMTGV